MSPQHRIVFARARLLCHIVARGRCGLLCLLHACRTDVRRWYATVFSDLTWIAATSTKLDSLKTAEASEWIQYFRTNGKKDFEPLRSALVGLVAIVSATESFAIASAVIEITDMDCSCDACGVMFYTHRFLVTHNVRHHMKLRIARAYVVGDTCP